MTETFRDPSLSFLWMEVSNLHASVDFYRQTLGFPVTEDGGLATVHLDNCRFYLIQGAPRGYGLQIGIAVLSVDALCQRLRRYGLAVAAPVEESWARYVPLTDPDGYRLLLLELKP